MTVFPFESEFVDGHLAGPWPLYSMVSSPNVFR
jgi:hypothetical protein